MNCGSGFVDLSRIPSPPSQRVPDPTIIRIQIECTIKVLLASNPELDVLEFGYWIRSQGNQRCDMIRIQRDGSVQCSFSGLPGLGKIRISVRPGFAKPAVLNNCPRDFIQVLIQACPGLDEIRVLCDGRLEQFALSPVSILRYRFAAVNAIRPYKEVIGLDALGRHFFQHADAVGHDLEFY